MQIAKYNERVEIEKNETMVDKVGNHLNTWAPFYSCYAYANTFEEAEKKGEVVIEDRTIQFHLCYCSEVRGIDPLHYRVRFHGQLYNITSVDFMNYQRKTVKLTCRSELRQPKNGGGRP